LLGELDLLMTAGGSEDTSNGLGAWASGPLLQAEKIMAQTAKIPKI
jgi:hypothetical protein